MKLYTENGVTPPAVEVLKDEDPAPGGYTEVTDICDWETYGKPAIGKWSWFRDYKCLREELKTRINTKAGFDPQDEQTYNQTNWDKLTANEKDLASRYFFVPEPLRVQVHTMDQQIEFGIVFNEEATKSRVARFDRAKSEAYCRLDFGDACEVIDELQQVTKNTVIELDVDDKLINKAIVKTLRDSYRECGVEGTVEDQGLVGLFDYLLSRADTPFAGLGLSSKAYTVVGMTDCAELADKLHDILSKGKY